MMAVGAISVRSTNSAAVSEIMEWYCLQCAAEQQSGFQSENPHDKIDPCGTLP